MDKNKNAQGQQKQGQQGQGGKDRNWNDTSQSTTDREPVEGGRGQHTGNRGATERGAGSQGERNSSGISNRGMDRAEEQADLPSRGTGDQDTNDQSER